LDILFLHVKTISGSPEFPLCRHAVVVILPFCFDTGVTLSLDNQLATLSQPTIF
jgi:hypothetical protein